MEVVCTREKIFDMLSRWGTGEISTQEIFNWANSLYLSDECTYDDWEGDNSVSNEVLSYLDTLDMNLITQEDIPALTALLNSSIGCFKVGLANWQKYIKSIDYIARKRSLKEDPLYRPFCVDIS